MIDGIAVSTSASIEFVECRRTVDGLFTLVGRK